MSKRKLNIERKTKANGYTYILDHPNHKFKVNLKTNNANWGISFTIEGNEIRKSSFGDIQPNNHQNTFNRMEEWEGVIYSIIELYVYDYDNLLLALDNTIS